MWVMRIGTPEMHVVDRKHVIRESLARWRFYGPKIIDNAYRFSSFKSRWFIHETGSWLAQTIKTVIKSDSYLLTNRRLNY